MKLIDKLFCEHKWSEGIDERFDQFNVAYTVRRRCLKCGKIKRFYGRLGKEEFEKKSQSEGKILSDISKRELIVMGFETARGIDIKNNGRDLITIETLGDNLFKVTLIKRVGSFYSTKQPRKSEY